MEYTFTYKKTLLHTLFSLFLKSLKAFSVSLTRLKTGMFLLNLSERFDVFVYLIANTFTTWRKFLYHELTLCFPFLSQKLVTKYLPKSFEKFPTIRINIDGTEIFAGRATSVKTQAQT